MKLLLKVVILILCILLFVKSIGWLQYADGVLHNGTNVDDDSARIIGGLSVLLGFGVAVTAIAILTDFVTKFFKPKQGKLDDQGT